MGIFYHFSHFFEIMAGIYFGGFALLSTLEGGVGNIKKRLQKRNEDARYAQTIAKEFFNLKFQSVYGKPFRLILFLLFCLFYGIIEGLGKAYFWIANKSIQKIVDPKHKRLQKQFFPSFFFAGCFCLVMILLSAIQVANANTAYCHSSIDYFILYYIFFSFIFQFWALVLFPFLMDKIEYIHWVFLNLIICIVLIYLSIQFSVFQNQPKWLLWFLNEHHEMSLITLVVVTALLPLLFIFFKSGFVIICWEIPILLTKGSLLAFGGLKFAGDVQDLIDDFKIEKDEKEKTN